ncbi:hypothetical protein [Streptomyces sp. NPDC059262]|uniref:hypothetical protein n=1 Tax=Streptomyces sp. NPDC059262 TaxID=3346797 RepID=UPI00369F1F6D
MSASTCFANPAVTIGRAFSDTFDGIVGAIAGAILANAMFAQPRVSPVKTTPSCSGASREMAPGVRRTVKRAVRYGHDQVTVRVAQIRAGVRLRRPLDLHPGLTRQQALNALRQQVPACVHRRPDMALVMLDQGTLKAAPSCDGAPKSSSRAMRAVMRLLTGSCWTSKP